MKRFARWFAAYFRLNKRIVCEESAGKGMYDYHDCADDEFAVPWHMAPLKCKRCGKEFFV